MVCMYCIGDVLIGYSGDIGRLLIAGGDFRVNKGVIVLSGYLSVNTSKCFSGYLWVYMGVMVLGVP